MKIPEGAHEEVWSSIPRSDEWKVPASFFEHQANLIIQQRDTTVPKGFFDKNEAEIWAKTAGKKVLSEDKNKARVIRLTWISIAAAASIVGAFVLFYPKSESPSFADLWHQSPLTEDEIIEEVSAEELMEVFPEDITTLSDTLIDQVINDSTTVTVDSLKTPIKPLEKKAIPKWEDISTEEIIQFLMENGDEDLFN